MKNLPLCFVLMPFGIKANKDGRTINFDAVYDEIIAPAIRLSGLEPLRADEEKFGGIIHKAMYERLILCEYAIADLTTANANVFYELGVRHATRPAATALIFAEGFGALPFDVNALRGLPYQLGSNGKPSQPELDKKKLAEKLKYWRDNVLSPTTDSPIYQLLQDFPDIQHLKTDVFRNQAEYSEDVKIRLKDAREIQPSTDALALISEIREEIENLADVEPGILIDILLSYRAVSAWPSMIQLVESIPRIIRDTVLVQEQYGFALNRSNQSKKAERVLLNVLEKYGASSETYGLLGRVYKDRWEMARVSGKQTLAAGTLQLAIDAYLKGFEADWRDAYPGINALTLMEYGESPDPRQKQLIPVVSYAVERRMANGEPDYWDYATILELKILARDEPGARKALSVTLPAIRESWEPETTARNLKLIHENRLSRGEEVNYIDAIIQELRASS
jgi:hypothetical protein